MSNTLEYLWIRIIIFQWYNPHKSISVFFEWPFPQCLTVTSSCPGSLMDHSQHRQDFFSPSKTKTGLMRLKQGDDFRPNVSTDSQPATLCLGNSTQEWCSCFQLAQIERQEFAFDDLMIFEDRVTKFVVLFSSFCSKFVSRYLLFTPVTCVIPRAMPL